MVVLIHAQVDNDVKFYNLEKEYRRTVSYVYRVQNTEALELKQIVREMLSIYGVVYVNEETNELYITDVEEKIEDLKRVLPSLDKEGLKAGNNLMSEVIYLEHGNAAEIIDILKHKLSAEGRIFQVPYLNALTITDIPSKIEELKQLMSELDVPIKHIGIEIIIIEFNSEKFAQLGLNLYNWLQDFNLRVEVNDNSFGGMAGGRFMGRSRGKRIIETRPTTFPYQLAADFSVSDIINFICEHGDGTILAQTQLVTRNNKGASISAQEVIPYRFYQHDVLDENAIENRAVTGLSVSVVPTVQEDSLINLSIVPRIADLTGWSPKGMPIVFERSMQTEVKVRDNTVFVLGGLKKREAVSVRRGIPGLKDVPVLRYLFSVEREAVVEREVILFIRPTTAIDPHVDSDAFSETLQRYRERTGAEETPADSSAGIDE
jgi:type II secretory pathway component GspD/PulD (secretin)